MSAFLNLVAIDRNGLGNTYYAVTVQSMLRNWHNWFFVSFDPGGFVSVDKPPLGFWIQSISVRLFGFNGIALVLPQAIAGVLSIWLLYRIIRLHFDAAAALCGAFIFAISPISVVTNRSNILESLLVFFVLAATYTTSRAIQNGSLRWLMASGVLLGLAFNIKMLEAYLVVPALVVAYLLAPTISWRTKIGQIAAAGAVMIAVSFAWISAVDLTPAADRPYVGSSYHNSELDLVWLYNGVQRLIGTPWTKPLLAGDPRGVPGPLRLIIPHLAGQSGWFLLLALPMVGLVAYRPWRDEGHALSPRQIALVLWGLWLIPMAIFFSMAHFFNIYYLAMLSPAIAALAGIGVVTCWTNREQDEWLKWLLGGGIIATVVEQVSILSSVPFWNPWLIAMLGLLLGIFMAAWLGMLTLRSEPARTRKLLEAIAAVSLVCTLCFAPFLWTLSSIHPAADPIIPVSGPLSTTNAGAVQPGPSAILIAYLKRNAGSTRFLTATVDAGTAIPIFLATRAPVMAMGGYSGFDPILTPATLAQRVSGHVVRFFYLPSSNLTTDQAMNLYPQAGSIPPHFTNALTQWVATHCEAVPLNAWDAMYPQTATKPDAMQLFDCGRA